MSRQREIDAMRSKIESLERDSSFEVEEYTMTDFESPEHSIQPLGLPTGEIFDMKVPPVEYIQFECVLHTAKWE